MGFSSCFCTGRCRTLGYCPVIGPFPTAPLERGRVEIKEKPLTEEDVRRIIRDEISKAGRRLAG